uniref:SfiI-subtelomeric related protein family member, putative n=1 Tax=Theileria annulata TaxID=5874 RepID=A0A3B0MZK9_THEAN
MLKPLDLDILTLKSKSTGLKRLFELFLPFFDFNGVLENGKYTSKEGYGISKIIDGTEDVWTARDESEYATKAFISSSYKKYVVIKLLNGDYEVFHNSRNGHGWREITEDCLYISKIRLFDESGNEVTEPELSYSLISSDFIINLNFKCSKIKYGTHTVWKLANSHDELPQALLVSLKYQHMSLLLKNCKKVVVFINYNIVKNVLQLKPVEVDGDIEMTTENIVYREPFNKIYEANRGLGICSFKLNNEVVWKAKDTSEYAVKIIYSEYLTSKILLIYNNIDYTVLSKSFSETWQDATVHSRDLSKLRFFDDKKNQFDIFDTFFYSDESKIVIYFYCNCSQINYGDKVIWKRKMFQKYPLDISIDLMDNIVDFHFKNGINKYYFTDDGLGRFVLDKTESRC